MGEGTFLKESSLPPYPHLQRTLKMGFIFYLNTLCSTLILL